MHALKTIPYLVSNQRTADASRENIRNIWENKAKKGASNTFVF
jgi:hypothetical protein